MKKILNLIALISLLCGGLPLIYGLTIHYEYTNIDIYETIIEVSFISLIMVLLINYVWYKKLALWHKNI